MTPVVALHALGFVQPSSYGIQAPSSPSPTISN